MTSSVHRFMEPGFWSHAREASRLLLVDFVLGLKAALR